MKVQASWTTESEREHIVEVALRLVGDVGMSLRGSRSLTMLRDAGVEVDLQTETVRFPEELVRAALEKCPREILLAGAHESKDVILRDGAPSHFCPAGCAAITLDVATGRRRESTLEDLRLATALLDEIPELEVMWTTVTAGDVPRERRELVEYYTVFCETAKHVTFVDCPAAYEPIREMAAVLAGDLAQFSRRPRFSTLLTVASPFQMDGRSLDFHASMARLGAPVLIYSVPLAGATAPVTVSGCATQAVAEFLGALTAIQILAPGARVVFGGAPLILDMRASTMATGAPESALMDVIAVEIAHHLGVSVITPGMGTDAKHPGVQAGYEKALKGLATVQAGADMISGGIGLLEGANLLYLPQIVIDAEIVAMIKRLTGDVDISDGTIAEDDIAAVGIGGDFLGLKSTRRRLRAGEHRLPIISSRLAYAAWEADGRDEVAVAKEQVDTLLARHEDRNRPLSDDQRSELRKLSGLVADAE